MIPDARLSPLECLEWPTLHILQDYQNTMITAYRATSETCLEIDLLYFGKLYLILVRENKYQANAFGKLCSCQIVSLLSLRISLAMAVLCMFQAKFAYLCSLLLLSSCLVNVFAVNLDDLFRVKGGTTNGGCDDQKATLQKWLDDIEALVSES